MTSSAPSLKALAIECHKNTCDCQDEEEYKSGLLTYKDCANYDDIFAALQKAHDAGRREERIKWIVRDTCDAVRARGYDDA